MDPTSSGFSNLGFYLIGLILILLGVAFLLVPLLGSVGTFNNVRIPWIILYIYKSDNFYFVTSPILIIISLITILVLLIRR